MDRGSGSWLTPPIEQVIINFKKNMKKINELNINISTAVITSVTLSLGEEGLEVIVSGSLMTDSGQQVSNFQFNSKKYSWEKESEIEVPLSLNFPAKEIFEKLTPVIYEKLNGKFMAIKGENK